MAFSIRVNRSAFREVTEHGIGVIFGLPAGPMEGLAWVVLIVASL
jgi:hypothetical protein